MRAKYEFKRRLEELSTKSGKGTELISVYIPPDKKISDVTSQLKDERGQASNIKSKSTRTNVQAALDSITSRLKQMKSPPERGIVIFCGAIDVGGDRTEMETMMIEPLETITSYKYHCNSTFLLEPLEEMLKEKKTFGLLVLDKREATIGLLIGKRIEMKKHVTSSVPGKQRKGGQSARRFERLREIAIEDFYKRVGKHTNDILLSLSDLQGILIGGSGPTKDEFMKGNHLHYELQKKILGGFNVAYTNEFGLGELVDAAQDKLSELDLMREKRLMSRFMRELVNNSTAYGEEMIREKIMEGAVDVLLISEDLRREKLRVTCENCGYTKEMRSTEEKYRCPECGSNLKIIEKKDVILELSGMAEEAGADVQFISADFEEGSQLKNAFDGMAAILRY
jgi:peptide chain release factor subunit 1